MSTQTLRVSLPSEIIYVSGTVNDVAYTWTLEDGAWVAVVDRAEDDRYVVVLTAVNSLGTSATYQLTLFYGLLNLITDRTKADVDRAIYLRDRVKLGLASEEEESEWKTDLKGAYNASDLNRVGAAVKYIQDRLKNLSYFADVVIATDWKMDDLPTPAQMEQYRQNVNVLREKIHEVLAYYNAESQYPLPTVPDDMHGLTYQEANDIEQILLSIDKQLTYMSNHFCWIYSGDLYAGEL